MKKFLLSLTLLFAVILGNSQVILNEIYTIPGTSGPANNLKTNHEFFELYNTSIDPTPIPLDCYTLIVMYTTASTKGFYALDFPNISIGPKGYIVGAAKNPFDAQVRPDVDADDKNISADFSWNSLGTDGSLKKYELQGSEFVDITLDPSKGIPANFNDLFSQTTFGVQYAMFLFDNTGKYINGLVTNPNKKDNIVPPSITNVLPATTISTNCKNSASTLSIDWTKLGFAEYSGANDGSDNGYLREFDGNCGSWKKAASNHSPGKTNNEQGAASNIIGTLKTTETLICGTRIDFSITAPTTTSSAYPVEVQLYVDKDGDRLLESTDAYVDKYDTAITLGSNLIYSFVDLPVLNDINFPNQQYILVYKTALGCFDAIVAPKAADLVTFQRSNCGKSIEFGVTSVTGDLAGNTTGNIVATLYEDVNNNNTYEAGTDLEVSDVSPQSIIIGTTHTINIPVISQGKNFIIVFRSSPSCIVEVHEPTLVNNSVTVDAGGSISFDIDGENKRTAKYQVLTGTNALAYPLTLKVYEDADNDGFIEDAQLAAGTQTITSAMSDDNIVYEVLIDKNSGIIVTAESIYGCSSDILVIDAQESVLPVTYVSFTATRSSNSQVVLEWETAMEENNKGFHVQRNINGEWKNIGFVFTQANNGNSTSSLKYSFKDNNSSKGISQYRILQVDMDGKGRYSDVRSIRGEEMAARLTVFPNPSNTGAFSILFEDGGSVRDVVVSDVSGRAIKQFKGVSNSSLTIENLGAGFYTVQVLNRTTGAMATEKVIVKKR